MAVHPRHAAPEEHAREADLPVLHSFTRGLDQDIAAVTAAPTLPFHNGRTEGVSTKAKMIKRDKCTDEQASPSVTGYSADATNRNHRKCERAFNYTGPDRTTRRCQMLPWLDMCRGVFRLALW